MPADIIRAQYQELDAIAKRFQQQAEAQTQLRTRLTRAVRALQQGGWVGKGASAFFAEMDNVIFPALQRSVDACGQGNQVTRMIIEILQAAEREASSPFRTGATVGATATDASAVGSTGSGPMTSGSFTLGPPHRPESIYHDNGFLDRFHPESPTLQDYTQLGKWRILLAGSKLATKAGVKDLDDANDAYEHFLDGKGADRTFNLDEYIAEDPSGRQNLQTAVQDARQAAETLGHDRTHFQMSSNRGFAVGTTDKFHPDYKRFDYPATENWQKAIGAHQLWTSADVQVKTNADGTRHYTMALTVHAEDRYNFNPDKKDIATGIPNTDNGRFEVTGLAKQYMNYGETRRVVEWEEGKAPSVIP